MPLDWLNTPLDVPISELIARKKRAQTIDMLRTQLQGRLAPGVQVRLQLADLLVQAGRVGEAVPVLIGLADEFAADGFVAKAIAILKRIEKVEGGREDVESRIASLVQQQQRSLATGGAVPAAGRRSRMPAFGIEEFSDEPVAGLDAGVPTDAAPVDPASGVSAEPRRESLDTATGGAYDAAIETPAAADHETPAEPAPVAEPAPMAEPETAEETVDVGTPPSEDAPPASPSPMDAGSPASEAAPAKPAGVAKRIRGAFRRFLAALPGGDEPAATMAAEAADVEAAPSDESSPPASMESEDAAPPLADADTAEAEEATPPTDSAPPAGPEPSGTSSPPAEAPASPAAPAPAAAAPDQAVAVTVEPDGMTDEAYEEQLLDIVQDVLQRPVQPPPAAKAMDRARVLEYAQRLLATPLLATLTEEELLAVVQGLRVITAEPGDIVVTEGGPGEGLFILTSGLVRVFVRNPVGRNFEVAALLGGDFFGEISTLSGRARTATVVAAAPSDLLELDKPTLDALARTHPRVCLVLENAYVQRATSPEAAAIRAVPVSDPAAQARADAVLQAHFGEKQWDPRMRLRLADLLVRTGKVEDAVPILTDLADDLAREGYTEKAIAILKKIERLRRRDEEEVSLAPLLRIEPDEDPAALAPPAAGMSRGRSRPRTDSFFHGWLLDMARDAISKRQGGAAPAVRPSGQALGGYGPGLMANPLFEGFEEDELVALIEGLRLVAFESGEMIVTEGEPGESLFILTGGTVKVFVRAPDGRDALVCALDEGAFFGEIAALSGQRRCATVTAASPCELLELDRPTLDAISERHPGVRTILEDASQRRVTDPHAVALRRGETPTPR